MPKKQGIKALFNNIAPEYDKLNHILSLDIDKIWRRRAVKYIIEPQKAQKLLDIACGTGDFTLAIAKKANPESEIIGLDLSEEMMKIGRKKIEGEGYSSRISLVEGDSEAIKYSTGYFDRVSVAFGVRNFENLSLGLSEMHRVLKPGGRLVILELSIPSNPIFLYLYKLYFLKILPFIGGKISGNKSAYEYLPSSVMNFPKPDKFKGIMSDCGFKNIIYKPYTFGICSLFIGEKDTD